MNLRLIVVESQKQSWCEEAKSSYQSKIARIIGFEIQTIKSTVGPRERANNKVEKDDQKILTAIRPGEYLVLLDVDGKTFSSSEKFAEAFERIRKLNKTRVAFIIGGAFGVGEAVKNRADESWSLSALTMNHQVAAVSFLEQLYRALTILRGIPYHNA